MHAHPHLSLPLVPLPPTAQHLPQVSAANPGKRIDFTRHPVPPDSAAPFAGAFGADLRGGAAYAGTLFRLPLRTAGQAAESGISRQAYSPDKVASMLAALRDEAPLVLLFLKHVRRVEAYDWADGAAAPRLLFSCEAVPLAPTALAAALGAHTQPLEAAAAAGGPAAVPAGQEGEWRQLDQQRALFVRAAEAPDGEQVASTYGVALVTW